MHVATMPRIVHLLKAAALCTLLLAPASLEVRAQEAPKPATHSQLKHAYVRLVTATTDAAKTNAQAVVDAASRQARYKALVDLLDHGNRGVRSMAACGLTAVAAKEAVPQLVHRFVHEPKNEVRVELTRTIRALSPKKPGALFLRYLGEQDYRHRYRALLGVGAFGHRGMTPAMISHMRLVLSGFGRAAVQFTTQRAYIRDWNLVSGGSGLVVTEIADPVIDVVTTGVTMDVQVRRVELSLVVQVLQTHSGQSFGAEPEAWSLWWNNSQQR